MPSGPTRDRRLKTDPKLERRRENAATCQPMDVDVSVSAEEEERLLAEVMPSPETSTLVQALQGRLSPVKTTPVTEPAEATSSSIFASSHISTTKSRSPVCFPSPEPRRCSPRKETQVEKRTREPSGRYRRTSPRQQPRSSRRNSPRKRPSSTSGHRGSPVPPPKRHAPLQLCSRSLTEPFEVSTAQAASVDLELAIDPPPPPPPPPPRGSFVYYDFLKLQYIRNKMTHVSPPYVGALMCNINANYTTQNYIFRLM